MTVLHRKSRTGSDEKKDTIRIAPTVKIPMIMSRFFCVKSFVLRIPRLFRLRFIQASFRVNTPFGLMNIQMTISAAGIRL